MSVQERETAVLDRIRASLIAEGFDVIVQPQKLDLPEFLEGFAPDAIAQRGDEHVVVEVVSRAASSKAKLHALQQALRGHPGWRLRTIWTSTRTVPSSLRAPSLQAVSASLHEVDELLEARHLQPAFLMSWAALEALGRMLLPKELQKPQTPGRVIEYLASSGFISRDEASRLRKLVDERNRLIHGELHAEISEGNVIEIRDVLWKLHDIARDGPEID